MATRAVSAAACSCTTPGCLPQFLESGCSTMVHRVDLKIALPPRGDALVTFHSVAVSFPTPIALSAAMASLFRAAYQASQQRECSQAYPVGSTP
jgi:hypothetical protein